MSALIPKRCPSPTPPIAPAIVGFFTLLFSLLPLALHAQTNEAPLTTAAQIRSLTPEEAAQLLPIRLQGCFMAKEVDSFALQDDTDGIFVFAEPELSIDFEPGDLIEVIGVTNPGDYAPCATATSVRRIGRIAFPNPIPSTIDELHSGQMDAKWVEISGIVRSVEKTPKRPPQERNETVYPPTAPEVDWSTRIKIGDGKSQVVVELKEELDPQLYLDAKVSLRGHCFYLHNGNRQFVRPILHVPAGIRPKIIQPALHNDFDGPHRPVSSLFKFDQTGGNPGHRVHVRGVVTHHRPGQVFWIRDGSHSLRIQCEQEGQLQPGDLVDALGFPELGTYSPVLSDAEFKKREAQATPAPVVLDDIRMISRHDSDLVQLEAHLVETQRYPDHVELTLEGLETTVRASLLIGPEPFSLPNWRPGSIVRVTGIASVGEGETIPLNGLWWPESLHLLMRSAADLAVIAPAPWWTPERIAWLLSGILLVAMGSIALIILASRRRLRDQAQQRAMAESEFSAILNERNRVAREIHDTLSQNIGAISVQLEFVRSNAKELNDITQKHLGIAHKLARNALTDARDSIWNMRSQVLEKYDLGGALESITQQLTDDTGIISSVEVIGTPKRLPTDLENNLLRVGQEAVTNACKHAQANTIEVSISYHRRKVELEIRDDGIGFDVQNVSPDQKRSFGLVGIRERVELLAGDVEIQSSPGNGTLIRAIISF